MQPDPPILGEAPGRAEHAPGTKNVQVHALHGRWGARGRWRWWLGLKLLFPGYLVVRIEPGIDRWHDAAPGHWRWTRRRWSGPRLWPRSMALFLGLVRDDGCFGVVSILSFAPRLRLELPLIRQSAHKVHRSPEPHCDCTDRQQPSHKVLRDTGLGYLLRRHYRSLSWWGPLGDRRAARQAERSALASACGVALPARCVCWKASRADGGTRHSFPCSL